VNRETVGSAIYPPLVGCADLGTKEFSLTEITGNTEQLAILSL